MRIPCLLATLLMIAPALGSGMGFGLPGGTDFCPEIARTQLVLIARALQLSDDQLQAARDLYDAHVAELESASAAFLAESEDLIDRAEMLGDGALAKKIFDHASEWEGRKENLENSFLQELRLLLDAEQDSRWALVQREIRRIKAMPFGRMLGENLDVFALIDALAIEPNPLMLDILDQYSRDLDPALQARDDMQRESAIEADEALTKNPARAKQLFERSRALRMAVRDINIRTIDQLAAAASPDDGARIRAEFRDRASAALELNKSRLAETIDAIGTLPSLTGPQRATFTTIVGAYRVARTDWDDRYIQAVLRAEEQTLPPPLQNALAAIAKPKIQESDQPEEVDDASWNVISERSKIDSLHRLWDERIELDRTTRASLRDMLDEAQRTSIVSKRNGVTVFVGELFGTEEYFSL